MLKFGIPLKLFSDRDPSFESSLYQELLRMLGVKKLRTCGYNPRSNGLTEKLNDYIKRYLATFVNFVGREWDKWLNEAAYAYNSSAHTSNEFTSSKLMFGRDYRVPLQVLYGSTSNSSSRHMTIDQCEAMLSELYRLAKGKMALIQMEPLRIRIMTGKCGIIV